MSAENVEIVRRVYDAATDGDTATLFELYDPEVEWDTSHDAYWGELVGQGVYRGREGLRRWFREMNEAWETITHSPEELIDVDPLVVSVNAAHGTGRHSGIDVKGINYGVWTVRGGRVVRVVWFTTRREALEAAGLSE